MKSYSDNAYDVTNFFGCFEKFLAYTIFLPSFIVVRHQMAELTWGGGFFALPVQNRVKYMYMCLGMSAFVEEQ